METAPPKTLQNAIKMMAKWRKKITRMTILKMKRQKTERVNVQFISYFIRSAQVTITLNVVHNFTANDEIYKVPPDSTLAEVEMKRTIPPPRPPMAKTKPVERPPSPKIPEVADTPETIQNEEKTDTTEVGFPLLRLKNNLRD